MHVLVFDWANAKKGRDSVGCILLDLMCYGGCSTIVRYNLDMLKMTTMANVMWM